jgi:ComF family protein
MDRMEPERPTRQRGLMWRSVRRLLDAVLPRHCARCGQPLVEAALVSFCTACWQQIRLIKPPYCPGCGLPFRSPVALTHSPGHRCGECRSHPPPFDHARAVGYYEGTLRQAIHLFKYRGKLGLQRPLLQLAIAHLDDQYRRTAYDVILPVPLHRSRLMQREFNQAALLARGLAPHLQAPVVERLLVRIRRTRPQVELREEERRRNLKDAFAVVEPARIAGKVVLLVDDVLTTGATMGEAAGVLKAAGAQQVDVWALARVVRGVD